MQCMKCGREISETQVFCDSCLETMSRYPIKPGTPVQILPRIPKDKNARRRELSPEELLQKQKRITARLYLLVLIFGVALLGAIGWLLTFLLPLFGITLF